MNILFGKISAILMGLILAVTLFLAADTARDYYYELQPVSAYFEAQTEIPDFRQGTNPLVVYNRTIHQNFTGEYIVEVKSVNNRMPVCLGDGISHYETTDVLIPEDVNLDWYVNDEGCSEKLEPGQYVAETTYNIYPDGTNFRKTYTTISNIFKVLPLE